MAKISKPQSHSLPSSLPDYLQEEMTLLNTVRCMVSNSLDLNDPQLTISMLDVTIQYLFETKRFDAQYLRCSPDDNH